MQFVVLSSSRGTTFEAVLDRIGDGSLRATCIGLISNKEDNDCVDVAKAANVQVKIVERQNGESRDEYDKRLDKAIHTLGGADIVATLGWMWILSPWFVTQWKNRIVNVHPSLLPKHSGAHAHEDVLAAGDTESGMTIHLIDEGVDTGKILLQKSCEVLSDDTVDSLKDRVQGLEKEWYPKVLQMIEKRKIQL